MSSDTLALITLIFVWSLMLIACLRLVKVDEEAEEQQREADALKGLRAVHKAHLETSILLHNLERAAEARRASRFTGTTIDITPSRVAPSPAPPPAQRRASGRRERDDSTDFAVGMTTGIPMPSAHGIMGTAIHDSLHSTSSSFSTPGHSHSCDTSSSSSSSYSDSSSSSSCDSGSSSSSTD